MVGDPIQLGLDQGVVQQALTPFPPMVTLTGGHHPLSIALPLLVAGSSNGGDIGIIIIVVIRGSGALVVVKAGLAKKPALAVLPLCPLFDLLTFLQPVTGVTLFYAKVLVLVIEPPVAHNIKVLGV